MWQLLVGPEKAKKKKKKPNKQTNQKTKLQGISLEQMLCIYAESFDAIQMEGSVILINLD